MPPTCRARTCTPRGSTTSARWRSPCTGASAPPRGLCAPFVLNPHFQLLIILFAFSFSLKHVLFKNNNKKKQRHYFANRGLSSKSYGFSSSNVWMWELDHKESWVLKNGRFWTVVLEKTLESPVNSKEIQPVNPKGNQSWILIGRTDAETLILWPPDVKNWFTGKDPDAGKDWRQEEKGTTDKEMIGWHHWLDGHEFEQAPGVGDGRRGLAYCSP